MLDVISGLDLCLSTCNIPYHIYKGGYALHRNLNPSTLCSTFFVNNGWKYVNIWALAAVDVIMIHAPSTFPVSSLLHCLPKLFVCELVLH